MAGLFILGGSTYYSLLLLQSLQKQGLTSRFSLIALFGRNAARLELLQQAGTSLVDGTVPIIATDRIEDCLDPEYTYLFNQIRFGGLQSRDQDERIAIAQGLPADETIGIIGISNAIRTVTGLADLVGTLRAKTHPYTLVNFTNPCSIACQYLSEALDARVIGICDYPAYMQREVAKVLNLPPEAVTLDYFGLNHFGFVHAVHANGRDMLAEAKAARPSFMPDCNRHFASLLNISWSFVFEAERIAARQRSKPNRASSLLQIEGECDALLAAGVMKPASYLAVLAQRNCDWYDLAVSPVLGQLTGSATVPVYVNCTAGPALVSGSRDQVIEATCTLDPRRATFGPLPEAVERQPEYQLVRLMKQAELTLLDAITARAPDGVIGACLLNPMIASLDAAERYFEELRQSDPGIAEFWSRHG